MWKRLPENAFTQYGQTLRTFMMSKNPVSEVVEAVIANRKTEKVLCEVSTHEPVPRKLAQRYKEVILRSVKAAGWAPFHYPRNHDGITEPWRAHILWDDAARKLAIHLENELRLTSKEPRLAAACSALILVTWIPEFYGSKLANASSLSRENQISRDEEHLAATAAMVQNLLLLLTAHNMGTYWSSGGKLRHRKLLEHIGAGAEERLLAAVFVEYPELKDRPRERKPGSLRHNRGDQWIKEVQL